MGKMQSTKANNNIQTDEQIRPGQKERLRAALNILLEHIYTYRNHPVKNTTDAFNPTEEKVQENKEMLITRDSVSADDTHTSKIARQVSRKGRFRKPIKTDL